VVEKIPRSKPRNQKGREVNVRRIYKGEEAGKGVSLREFCKQIEVDASNWSKVERGLLAPPQDEQRLRRIARVLNIEIGSPYGEMKDKAAIDAGIIPEDIRTDEKV